MTGPLTPYESAVLAELRERVTTDPVAGPGRARSRRRLAVAGALTVAASLAVVLVVPGVGPEPAYSVQEGNSGEVDVEVHRFEDADGLEAALRDAGIAAEVTYVPDGGECVRDVDVVEGRRGISLEMGEEIFRVVLAPGTVREGETLVVDASIAPLPPEPEVDGVRTVDGSRYWFSVEVVRGDPGTCVWTTS